MVKLRAAVTMDIIIEVISNLRVKKYSDTH